MHASMYRRRSNSTMVVSVFSHNEYLYKKPWNKRIDGDFLSFINTHLGPTFGRQRHEVDECLALFMVELNRREHLHLDFEDVTCRLNSLKDRYEAFTIVLRDPDTKWDVDKGVVHAEDRVWERLIKENHLCAAYYKKAEPHYSLLCAVFGDMHDYAASDISDEATSPDVRSKRCMFDDFDNLPKEIPPRPDFSKPPSSGAARWGHSDSSCASSSAGGWPAWP